MSGPWFELVPLCVGLIAVTWLLSVITREYSWVDRIWSIAPPVYLWLVAWKTGFDARLVLMAALATAWGARLTFNYARKGGYWKGGEDYRWAVLREKLGPVGFQAFNATFISPYQNVLIFGLTAPAHTVAQVQAPLGTWDFVLAGVFLALLAGETVADQQQWNFHKHKTAPGFCSTGLFRYSRHPNFFFEVGQWWVMYGFAVVATGAALHWTIAGAVLLTLLFDGSTRFTESISAKKYPAYADYQRRTSRLVPWPPKR